MNSYEFRYDLEAEEFLPNVFGIADTELEVNSGLNSEILE